MYRLRMWYSYVVKLDNFIYRLCSDGNDDHCHPSMTDIWHSLIVTTGTTWIHSCITMHIVTRKGSGINTKKEIKAINDSWTNEFIEIVVRLYVSKGLSLILNMYCLNQKKMISIKIWVTSSTTIVAPIYWSQTPIHPSFLSDDGLMYCTLSSRSHVRN